MGILVAIEGIDGSGKGTQAALLRDRLAESGLRCDLLSFPRYRQTRFGSKIGDYLNGRFGSLDQVNPFLVTLLFSGDRFESRPVLTESLSTHDVVICDRYVASNIAHQAAKLDGAERQELIEWVEYIEFHLYALPRPALSLFLDVPVVQARDLVARKARRDYTDKTQDLQEADADYQRRVYEVYSQLSRSSGWTSIPCVAAGAVRPTAAIADDVAAALRTLPNWPTR